MVIKAYELFLLSNASQITAVESSLRSLTYFLPGRFKDAELAGEAIYSGMNLLGLYHDEILKSLVIYRDVSGSAAPRASSSAAGAATSPDSVPLLPYTPSPHARYTNHYSNSSPTYKLLARLLVVIGYTELLAEMVARRRLPSQKAWDVVLAIEGVKASLRLALYHLTSTRLTIEPPIPEREVDPEMLQKERNEALLSRAAGQVVPSSSSSAVSLPAAVPPAGSKKTWTGTRTKLVRPTLASLRSRTPRSVVDPVTGQPSDPPSRPPNSRSGSRSGPSSSRSHSISGLSSSGGSESDSESESDSDSSEETLVDPATGATTTSTVQPWTDNNINDYLTSKALTREDVMKPLELVRPLGPSKRAVLSEYLWVLRPLFYVVALKKWGTRRWEPWTISLGIEYLSHSLRQSAYASPLLAGKDQQGGILSPMLMGIMSAHPLLKIVARLVQSSTSAPKPRSAVEEAEWAKRRRAFVWYLLRGPIWHMYTRVKVQGLCDKFEGRMLLGILAAMVREYVPLVDDLYFYVN
ncbi:peroxisome membrane protein [Jaminaea rosea]|uniref:Peroxisomal membrane protein PEX16 n=1 Tax=Jaminaea rosea TaxID=1569628 RepID=A0A316V4H9_9BASI|nr:peroxisome membrane protein [Jaminaea rosea]PWN30355.1 peroxisome membrane protein [Jaminaea rosea]